jgi:hypothetical protein
VRTDAAAPVRGRDDELRRAGFGALVELQVPREGTVRIRQDVLDGASGAASRGEQGLLRDGRDAVFRLRGPDEREHRCLLVGGEQRGAGETRSHAAIPPRGAARREPNFGDIATSTAHITSIRR